MPSYTYEAYVSDDIYAILIERGLSSDEANIFARMSEGLQVDYSTIIR